MVVGATALPPYETALQAVQAHARSAGLPVASMDVSQVAPALQAGTLGRSDTFVALGARAVPAVLAAAQHGRALSCLTLGRTELPGVVLAHPARSRIAFVKQLLPHAKEVGVLFDPAADRKDLEALEAAATEAGLTLVAKPVEDPQQLDAQLARLANEADVLLATYDLGIHSAKNAPRLIRFSYQNRIPLVAMSEAWARAGALAGLDWDYRELAEACAVRAVQLARGEAVAAEQRPRSLPYALNAATARLLRIELPAEIAGRARAVFK